MKNVPNPGGSRVTPTAPSVTVDASRPPHPGTRFLQAMPPGSPREKCDPEWVWPRCLGKGPGGPVRPLGARTPGPRPAAKCRQGPRGQGPAHPIPSLCAVRPTGSVLPGPGKEETHFRRVHDLPRLLLTLAAGVGTGHQDRRTG